MILSVAKDSTLHTAFDQIGFGTAVREGGSVLVKINLAHQPEPLHPRTDPSLLLQVIQYITCHAAQCAIAEGADGFLPQNIESIAFGEVVKKYHLKLIDLDLEDADCIIIDGEKLSCTRGDASDLQASWSDFLQ